MLTHLTIRNYALVESADVAFEPGLSVITGESGAGKSILLGALGLVLGHRPTAHVRPDGLSVDVCAEFDVADMPAAVVLQDHDLIDADAPARCLIRRAIGRDGRSRAFVNGVPVTLAVLRAITGGLIEIHGQNEHLRLAERDNQLALLDDFAGTSSMRRTVRDAYRTWQAARQAVTDLKRSLKHNADRGALLAYQVAELDDAELVDGEQAALTAEHRRLSQAEDIGRLVGQILTGLEDTHLLALHRRLGEVDDPHPRLQAGLTLLETALVHLDEAAAELRAYAEAVEPDPARLAQLDDRLTHLHELSRKHHVRPDELFEHAAALSAELNTLSSDEAALPALIDAAQTAEHAFRQHADALGKARRAACEPFERAVSDRMQQLGIREGTMTVALEPAEGEDGLERAEFLVTTNPRYPAGPIGAIASGGEQSRISLAIDAVAAEKCRLPCLVLDEADVGVAGTAADVIGRMLRRLAQHTQVLCVSHAPQVAALADHHLVVRKRADQTTHIDPLGSEARVEEVARMLAGADVTDKSRAYAETLLEEAGRRGVGS